MFPLWALKWAFDCLPQIKMLKIHCSGLCFFQLCTVGLECIDIHSMLILILGIQCNCQQAVSKILNSIQDTLCTLLTMVMLLLKFLYILRIHKEVSL